MMTSATRQILVCLLNDLMSAQDTVTHHNERGPEHIHQTRIERARRDSIKNKILSYVDGKIAEVTE